MDKRVQTTLRLPPELEEAVEKEAADKGQSNNALYIIALKLGLEELQSHR